MSKWKVGIFQTELWVLISATPKISSFNWQSDIWGKISVFLFESNVGCEEYLKPFSWEGKNWIFFFFLLGVAQLFRFVQNKLWKGVTKTFWCCSFALCGRVTSHDAAQLLLCLKLFFIHSPRTLKWTFQRIQAHSAGIQKLLISLLAIFCNVLKCLFLMRVECYYFSSPMELLSTAPAEGGGEK